MGLFGGKKKVVIGYKYYMGMLLGICSGKRNDADLMELTKIIVGDRGAWSGSVTESSSIYINSPDLFGGEKNEGGIQGTVDVMMGESTQTKNGYLVRTMPGVIPAFRGMLGLALRQVYVTAMNPYIKKWAPEVKYIFRAWNSAEAQINGTEANPAHIVYECLTNADWGMGYPVSQIDATSFGTTSTELFNEGFGLSFLWTNTETLQDFVQRVIDHIGGVLSTDPSTGKFTLRLIRDDYDPGTLPVFGPSNIVTLSSYERQGWGETVNELTVVYTDPQTDKPASVTVQDLGNIQAQGQVISKSTEYPGIRNGDLAYRVALRDLKAGASPLAKLSIKVNRQAWSTRPGGLFKLSWPKLGVVEQIFRVGKIDTGTLTDGTIRIEAVEDVFSMPASTYAEIQPPGWLPVNNPPAPALFRLVQEMAYFYIAQALGDDDAAALDPTAGYVMTLAAPPSGDAFNYDLLTRVGSANYVKDDTPSWAPLTQLADNIDETATVLTISDVAPLGSSELGLYLMGGSEFVEVLDIDLAAGELTVNRGMLDTLPQPHPIGALIYDVAENLGAPETEYYDGEVVDVKMLPTTTLGTLEESAAPVDSVTMDERQVRPYSPGDVRLNGSYFPAEITGELTVTWAYRDRLQQTSPTTLINQGDSSVGPEAGTTYTIRVYGQPAFPGGPQPLIKTQTGETGVSWTYPEADEKADSGLSHLNALLRVEVESVRGGYVSWQAWSVTTSREIVTTDLNIQQVTVPGDTDLALG